MKKIFLSLFVVILGANIGWGACPALTKQQLHGLACSNDRLPLNLPDGFTYSSLGTGGADICSAGGAETVSGIEKPQRVCAYSPSRQAGWGSYFTFDNFTLISTSGDMSAPCPGISLSDAAKFTAEPYSAYDSEGQVDPVKQINWYLFSKDQRSFVSARNKFPMNDLITVTRRINVGRLSGASIPNPPKACVYGSVTLGVLPTRK